MERLGILELTEINAADRQAEAVEIIKASKMTNQDMFLTVTKNDFGLIPEGFTGVYFRNYQYQIVPNELLPAIKELSIKGFHDVPEDHELFLLVDWFRPEGRKVGKAIVDLVTDWLKKNLQGWTI